MKSASTRFIFSKQKGTILGSLVFSVGVLVGNIAPSFAFDHSHKAFSNELQKYVEMDLVDYKSWRQSPANLKKYIDSLEAIKTEEYKSFSKDEKKAIWLNAYNAMTIYLVLKNYPIKGEKKYYPKSSIRQIDGFWEKNTISIGKKVVSLAQIEHNVLRRDFLDPRTHFAVVPASLGGAKIERVAYSAPSLDQWLASKTKEFLGNSKNVSVNTKSGEVFVTQLFRWFPLDFARSVGLEKQFPPPTDDQIIIAYLKKFGPASLKNKLEKLTPEQVESLKVVYRPFDWTLNDLSCD